MAPPTLPPQAPSWGTAARADAGDTRRTRGLGLGAAVRRYNDLAVPGIGGLWFAKPLVWSMIGLTLGGMGAEAESVRPKQAHSPIVSRFVADRLSALPVLAWCFMGSFGFGSLTRLWLSAHVYASRDWLGDEPGSDAPAAFRGPSR